MPVLNMGGKHLWNVHKYRIVEKICLVYIEYYFIIQYYYKELNNVTVKWKIFLTYIYT